MSVVISNPNLTGVVGAINCIKKLRMNAPSILGSVDLYFILTAAKRLYFTANLATNAPQEISLAAIPFLANATLHGMEVMVATESNANGNVKYPVVYLFGYDQSGAGFDGGINVTKPFVAVMKCAGIPTQPPNTTIYWPLVQGAPSTPNNVFNSTGPVEFVGYDGPANPSLVSFFGSSFGRTSIKANNSGLPSVENEGMWLWQDDTSLLAYGSALNFIDGVHYSGLDGLAQPRLLMMFRLDPFGPAWKVVLGELWGDSTETSNTLSFYELGAHGPVAYPTINNGDTFQAINPMTTADYEWLQSHGIKAVVLGWGLSGSDDPDGQTAQRLYGAVSLVFLGLDGTLRICGDGAGSLPGLNTPIGDTQPISAVAVGYQGTPDDADTKYGVASVPLYRKGVVLVSGRYVYYSANGLSYGTSPVLTMPDMVSDDPIYSVALSFTNYDAIFSAASSDYVGANWRLTVVFTPTGGGAPQVRSYSSVDGQNWNLVYSYDFASNGAASGTTSIEYASAKAYDNGTQIMVLVGRVCIGSSSTPQQLISWRYFNGEGYSDDTSMEFDLPNVGTHLQDMLYLTSSPGLRDLPQGITVLSASGRCGLFVGNQEWLGEFFWGMVDVNPWAEDPVDFLWESAPEWKTGRWWDLDNPVPRLVGVVDAYPYVLAGDASGNHSRPYGFVSTPFGSLVAKVFGVNEFGSVVSPTDIFGVRFREEVYSWGVSPVDLNGWSIFTVVSSPEKGSVVFWKDPVGIVSVVSFTDMGSASDFNRPSGFSVGAGAFIGDYQSAYGLGFFVNDVFAYTPGTASATPMSIYMTDIDGRIWVMLPGATAQVSLVSEYFLGKVNLRIAKAGEVWVVSYDGLNGDYEFVNSIVEFSFNFTDWFSGVALNGSSHPGLVSKAKDILPLGPSGNVERIIPDTELGSESSSIFINQIP